VGGPREQGRRGERKEGKSEVGLWGGRRGRGSGSIFKIPWAKQGTKASLHIKFTQSLLHWTFVR